MSLQEILSSECPLRKLDNQQMLRLGKLAHEFAHGFWYGDVSEEANSRLVGVARGHNLTNEEFEAYAACAAEHISGRCKQLVDLPANHILNEE